MALGDVVVVATADGDSGPVSPVPEEAVVMAVRRGGGGSGLILGGEGEEAGSRLAATRGSAFARGREVRERGSPLFFAAFGFTTFGAVAAGTAAPTAAAGCVFHSSFFFRRGRGGVGDGCGCCWCCCGDAAAPGAAASVSSGGGEVGGDRGWSSRGGGGGGYCCCWCRCGGGGGGSIAAAAASAVGADTVASDITRGDGDANVGGGGGGRVTLPTRASSSAPVAAVFSSVIPETSPTPADGLGKHTAFPVTTSSPPLPLPDAATSSLSARPIGTPDIPAAEEVMAEPPAVFSSGSITAPSLRGRGSIVATAIPSPLPPPPGPSPSPAAGLFSGSITAPSVWARGSVVVATSPPASKPSPSSSPPASAGSMSGVEATRRLVPLPILPPPLLSPPLPPHLPPLPPLELPPSTASVPVCLCAAPEAAPAAAPVDEVGGFGALLSPLGRGGGGRGGGGVGDRDPDPERPLPPPVPGLDGLSRRRSHMGSLTCTSPSLLCARSASSFHLGLTERALAEPTTKSPAKNNVREAYLWGELRCV